MSTPRDPPRRIVVAGGGQVGVLVAIALRRALPVCQLVVVGQSHTPASFADGAMTSLPFTNKLHDRLGIEESEIVLKAGGSHRLVTRFLGWAADGGGSTLSYGETLDPALKTAFAREWGGGRQVGTGKRPIGSLAEVLADSGRFAPPSPDQLSPLSDIDYALRWNPSAYRDLLIDHAQRLGVQYVEGEIAGVEPGDGDTISAIAISGQGRIEADLFIDCTGPAATIAASLPAFAMVDWSPTLPTRTIYLAQSGNPVIALEDRISLTQAGWVTQIAGRDGLHTALGVGEGVDREVALAALWQPAAAVINLAPGRIETPWIGNVIALGDASARFEPLGPFNLDLAHRQLALLLEILPGRTIEPTERAEYNRRSILMMEGVRETLALYYSSDTARPVFGDVEIMPCVDQVRDQFTRRGRIPFREEAPLSSQELFALLVALGSKPGMPPAMQSADARAEDQARMEFASASEAAVNFAPPYVNWLNSVLRASGSPA